MYRTSNSSTAHRGWPLWAAFGLLLSAACATAQVPPGPPTHGPVPPAFQHGPHAGWGPAPLLYTRILGPAGMHARFFQAALPGRDFPTPAAVGFRPGYAYRFELTGLPGHAGLALYPTLEVRGTLQLPPHLRPSDYPTPIVFTARDIDAALAGAVVTKAIFLEDPEKAFADTADVNQPVEIAVPPSADPLEEARKFGRPVAVLRFGGKQVPAEELARDSIPGTILMPGEHTLPPAAARPCLPWTGLVVFDPVLGPLPSEAECLHDGGSLTAGVDNAGRLIGLRPSDAAAAYTDDHGQRRVACSNRICICVPRFVVIRNELGLVAYQGATLVAQGQVVHGEEIIRTRLPSAQLVETKALEEVKTRVRPSAVIGVVGPGIVGRIEGLQVVGLARETGVISETCIKPVIVPPGKPLCLIKWADRDAAHVGDVVTMTLRYTNYGGRPITDVVVSDSLTGRLAYIPGTQRSDREAVFTTRPNEAGSVLLQWLVTGPLLPGQSGTVTFQVRVR